MNRADLKPIDPEWAWATYEPDAGNPWTIRAAAHAHRRLGFCADSHQLRRDAAAAPRAVIDALFHHAPSDATTPMAPASPASALETQMERLGQAMLAGNDSQSLSAWWLYRMVHTTDPLRERLTLCWHGHFATSAAKVPKPALMLAQNDLLRRHALGDFHQMVLGVSSDPAMLIWLDSTTNRRIRPNENYARELMELFCLGLGHYSERDIAEVARCFTGWEVHGERFVFNAHQHDTGVKRFLGAAGDFDGQDAVRIVLEQPAAARFIAAKLVRWLVADEPAIDPRVIQPLADRLRQTGFQIGPVVRAIASSNLFFSPHAVGRKVRSPVDFGVGLLRALRGATDMNALARRLDDLGQAVFFPPNVKGWDGGRTWIDAGTLLGRANLAHDLTIGGHGRFGDGGLGQLAEECDARTGPQIADWLIDLLLAVQPPITVRRMLADLADQPARDADLRIARVVHALTILPEFQLA